MLVKVPQIDLVHVFFITFCLFNSLTSVDHFIDILIMVKRPKFILRKMQSVEAALRMEILSYR